MTLQQLYYFKVIAKYMHFRKAAELIHISQPSLSQSIKNLENELGVPLFKKNGRNVEMTRYGETFLYKAQSILDEVEKLKKTMADMNKELISEIRIGCIAPISNDYLPNLISDFLKSDEFNEIKFSCDQGITKKLVSDVLNDKIDIGFGSYFNDNEEFRELEFYPVIEEEMSVIVPANHALAQYKSIELEMIEHFPVITINYSSSLGKKMKKIFKDNKININQACEVYDEHTIGVLVEKGIGIAYLPETVEIKKMIQDQKIKKVVVRNVKESRKIYMFYKKNIKDYKAVKKFIDYALKNNITKKEKNHGLY